MKNIKDFNKIKIFGIERYAAEGTLELNNNQKKIRYRMFELIEIRQHLKLIRPILIKMPSQSFN